jgi:alkanesulfonate monooxygenase SsuD/methylene tetrahydromethanopterin reductase-like flavin-dependent oxidoreductase (luciferase family)
MRVSVTGWQRDAADADPGRFLRHVAALDALGYDGVWLNEFHFQRGGLPYPSPLPLAAAIFARTERLRVGTSVIVLPLHHPLLVAAEVAQLDHLSGGRVDVGIGRGTISRAYGRLGLALDGESLRERFEEGYRLLLSAWAQPEVRHRGRFWTLDGVPAGPPPWQRPHPPLFVAGTSADTLRFAAAEGLPLLLAPQPPEAEQLAAYREAAGDGAARALPGPVLTRHVCIAPDAQRAALRLERLLPALLRRRRALAAQRGRPATAPPAAEALAGAARFRSQEVVAGDPAACLAQITALAAATGAAELRCVFNGDGATGPDAALALATLFAREVLPALHLLPNGGRSGL